MDTGKLRTEIVTPPFREGMRVPNGTEHGQVEDETDNLSSTIKGTGDDVVVYRVKLCKEGVRKGGLEAERTLSEPPWVLLTEPELRDQTDGHRGIYLSVDTNYSDSQLHEDMVSNHTEHGVGIKYEPER